RSSRRVALRRPRRWSVPGRRCAPATRAGAACPQRGREPHRGWEPHPTSLPSPRMAPRTAGTGYLTLPDRGTGPGVLVLHSWWGLTPFFRGVCDRLAEEGLVALAPELFAGRTADERAEGKALLAESDMDAMAHLVRSSLYTLRGLPATPEAPVGTLGFSMGGSWALWLAGRIPDLVGATVVFYGSQSI